MDVSYLGVTACNSIDCTSKQLTATLCLLISVFCIFLLFAFGQQPRSQPNNKHPYLHHPHESCMSNRHVLGSCQTFHSVTTWPRPIIIIFPIDANLFGRVQLLEPLCFPLELVTDICQGPLEAKTCVTALPSSAQIRLFLEKNSQLPVLASPGLVLNLCLILIFQLGSHFCLPDSGVSQIVWYSK